MKNQSFVGRSQIPSIGRIMTSRFLYRRRTFIAGLGSAAAWPAVARASQQQAMPLVGHLDLGPPEGRQSFVASFSDGLAELGFVEGRNIRIDHQFAKQEPDRLRAMAADLVRKQPAVIFTSGGRVAAVAAKAATTTKQAVVTEEATTITQNIGRNIAGEMHKQIIEEMRKRAQKL
jgi:ABC-type uncharacterized transport system substrate-binding protein